MAWRQARASGAGGASVRRPAVMGVGMARAGGRSGVVGVPGGQTGGGGEWGPHTKESIKCIPQSGTHKAQKEFLLQPRIPP